jgi:general secretion pathway protein C
VLSSAPRLVDAGRAAERLANRLVEPAKILVIVGIAYTLATAGWYLVSGPAPATLTDNKAATGRAAAKPSLSVADIIARNLFGKANVEGNAPAVYNAPETHLRLTLEGVFQAEVPEESAAIIAEQGRPGELFLVGGKMPGNATLTEVHADRIVMRRGSVFETLRFSDEPSMLTANSHDEPALLPDAMEGGENVVNEAPPDTGYEGNEAPPEPPPSTEGSANSNNLSTVVQGYRDRLQQDPAGTLSSLGVAPVSSSGAQGYRVDNLASSPYLAQTGLQAGDVVLSVNGRPVGDIQSDQAEIDNIVAQGSARLEVQRGARRFFVTTSLK